MKDVLPDNLGPQKDESRDTAYCSYSGFSFNDFEDVGPDETVEEFITRKLQFPECHDSAFEIFDDIYMVSKYLSSNLERDNRVSVTTAAGNRFEVSIMLNIDLIKVNDRRCHFFYCHKLSLFYNSNSLKSLFVFLFNGAYRYHCKIYSTTVSQG